MTTARWAGRANAWPWPTKRNKESPIEPKPVQDQKVALRALEEIQASRPMKPPGKR